MKLTELKEMAKNMKINKWYKMNKEPLIEAIIEQLKMNTTKSMICSDTQSTNKPESQTIKFKHQDNMCCGNNMIEKSNKFVLEQCSNVTNNKYCDKHSHKYRFTKPDECAVCFESFDERKDIPLNCGHWIHKHCLLLSRSSKCPCCRTELTDEEMKYTGLIHLSKYKEPTQLILINNRPVRNVSNLNNENVNVDTSTSIFGILLSGWRRMLNY